MNPSFIAIDRDGTIIENKNYLADPEGVEFVPNAIDGLLKLQQIGVPLVIITNQSGISRGYFTEEDMKSVHSAMLKELENRGVAPMPIYHCPHSPDDSCICRKPAPGMIEAAAQDLSLPAQDAVIIGDNRCDMELAKNIGCTGLMVRSGYGRGLEEEGYTTATAFIENLLEAAEWIGKQI